LQDPPIIVDLDFVTIDELDLLDGGVGSARKGESDGYGEDANDFSVGSHCYADDRLEAISCKSRSLFRFIVWRNSATRSWARGTPKPKRCQGVEINRREGSAGGRHIVTNRFSAHWLYLGSLGL
jgi:hypothetical protein